MLKNVAISSAMSFYPARDHKNYRRARQTQDFDDQINLAQINTRSYTR